MPWKKSDVFALMVGHGKSLDGSWDPGCTYGKYTEAGLMLDIVKVAVKWLRKSGVDVITDADDANNRNMKSSVAWANNRKAKIYISVHCDWSGSTAGIFPQIKTTADKKMADKIGKYVADKMGMKFKGACKRDDLYELNAPTANACCVFETGSIKADLKKLKDYKAYGKALAKGICKYLGVKFYVSNVTKFRKKLLFIFAEMKRLGFKYKNSGNAKTWAGAKKLRQSNCATAICYALQEAGFLKKGQIFWCNDGKVKSNVKGTIAQLKKVARIAHPKKKPSKTFLKVGDICGYSPHTQEFDGWTKSGKPMWYSFGPSDVGKKMPRHKKSYDSKKVEVRIRLK